jgi:hypothetical protein
MADYDSQLPIRSEADGTDERVHVKIVDYSDPGGADKQVEVSEKKAHVRIHSEDSDGNDLQPLLSQEGHVQSNGDYDATNNKRPSSQGLITSDRSAAPDETTMNKRVTAVAGNDDKVAMDVAISDSSGNRFDEDNPLPVYQTEDPGDEIVDFDEAVDIAKDAVGNHDYTVTVAKQFRSLNVEASASGKAKFELQIETAPAAGTFNTIGVQFNSTANPNVKFYITKPEAVAAGVIIRVAKTNLDNQAQSLYSTINGVEV